MSPSPTNGRMAHPPNVVAIAAGSTGGHRHIGQAIGEAYQKACPEGRVLYISSTRDSNLKLESVPRWQYERIPSLPFTGQGRAAKLRALRTLAGSILKSRKLLAGHGVERVVGCGSFASVAVVLAARTLGIPTLIHEANRVPGRANRLVMRFVDQILLGLEPETSVWRPSGHLVVGNPIRRALADTAITLARPFNERTGVLVLGGSQGSPFLNRSAPTLLKALIKDRPGSRIFHQAGEHPIQPIQQDYDRQGLDAVVQPFFDQLDERYAGARLAIATSGAVTLAELAAFGLPALLVPLRDAADDHQTFNARHIAQATGLPWCSETAWDKDALAPEVAPLLFDERHWQRVSKAIKTQWHSDAATRIFEACVVASRSPDRESVATRP